MELLLRKFRKETAQIATCNADLLEELAKNASLELFRTLPGKRPLDRSCNHGYFLVEGTPRTIWDSDNWHLEKANMGLEEPVEVTAHKVFHLNPDTKFLVMLRDPVERLFSDYRFFAVHELSPRGNVSASAEEFHLKILDAINWWKACVSVYSERRCAYGYHYPKLNHPPGSLMPWLLNASTADRLRISLYYFYVNDFLSVFPRNKFLFIKTEDYKQNRLTILTDKVYPFLEIEELSVDGYRETLALVANRNVNRGEDFQMHNQTKLLLRRFFAPYNQRLVELLKDPSFTWE